MSQPLGGPGLLLPTTVLVQYRVGMGLHAFWCDKCLRLVYRCMHCLEGIER